MPATRTSLQQATSRQALLAAYQPEGSVVHMDTGFCSSRSCLVLRAWYPWPVMVAVVTFVGILGGSVKKEQAVAGCDCKQWPTASSCAPHWNDHSRCWGVCCRGEKGQRRISAARKAPQFLSNGHLVGPGCCRTTGGGVRAWDEPSTAEAIATQRVHDLPMNRSACAAHCAALEGCTHFELNMSSQPVRSNQGVCSVFASGGFSVTTACKGGSKRPRIQCFAAVGHDHRLWHYSPPRSVKHRRSVAVCVVGQLRSAAQTAPTIRRHVLNVLDADAFMVSQLDDSSNERKDIDRLHHSLAIERLLGPRVRSAVHGTAQDFQSESLVNELEEVAEPPAAPLNS